jgi:UDP-glucose 4-epimerase
LELEKIDLKVLITGAFGSIGIYTLKELIKKGNKVSVLELKTRANQKIYDRFKSDIEIFWGDITEKDNVAKAVADQDVVIHLAFVIPSRSEDRPNWSWEINVEGTRNILNAMRYSHKKPRIVFASSVSVFGNTQKFTPPRTAAEQVMPTDNYSHHKVACEQLVKISGLDWTILRIGAVLSASLCEIDPMLFDVPLNTRIEVIHAHDAGIAFAAAAVSKDVWGKILLIGGGPNCQIYQRDLVRRVLEAVGIGMLPEKAFTSKSFYTDWIDTVESQNLLNYQNLALNDYINDIKNSMGFKRYLIRLVKPFVRYWLLRKSPYLMQREPGGNNIRLKLKGKVLTGT